MMRTKQKQRSRAPAMPHSGTTLHMRLIAFIAAGAIFIILSFSALLIMSGITSSSRNAVYYYLQSELDRVGGSMYDNFGRLSVQSVSLSQDISAVSDAFFKENKMNAAELAANPQLLEPLLARQIGPLISAFGRSTCSGAFIVLDATVLPDNSSGARAGIFLKVIRPNAVQSVENKIHYLRGPANVARSNGIDLLGQWRMEYDVNGEDFFSKTISAARNNPDLPLSRLYYWSGRTTLKGNSESGFLVSVPLRSADGTVYGVCGVEVSDRLFKLLYSPSENRYEGAFAAAAPTADGTVQAESGMIAGNYYLTGNKIEGELNISEGNYGFYQYRGETDYGGLHSELRLYPDGSAFTREKWAVGIMIPQAELSSIIYGSSASLIIIIVTLLLISMLISIIIAKRYLKPVTAAIDTIKSKDFSNTESSYREINDLMSFLAKQAQEQRQLIEEHELPPDLAPMLDEFLKNIRTLSPAEKNVFELYVRGYNASEIADKLHLSINTIKTHNRRIFGKLNVSSRKELLVYIDMMIELNLIEEV